MALTVRQNGTVVGGQPNTANASWWNDYYDLLTGAMTDQDLSPHTDLILSPISHAPASAPSAAASTGTGLGIGVYKYVVTFVKQGQSGETIASPSVTVTTTSGNQQVSLSAIPLGPSGTAKRNLYRTVVGGSAYLLVATIADNTTTTYTDSTADGSLGAAVPTKSTFGGRLLIKDSTGTVKASIIDDGSVSFDGGAFTSDGAGNLVALSLTLNGQTAVSLGPGSYAGSREFVGPNTPTGAVKGDRWTKTPF